MIFITLAAKPVSKAPHTLCRTWNTTCLFPRYHASMPAGSDALDTQIQKKIDYFKVKKSDLEKLILFLHVSCI